MSDAVTIVQQRLLFSAAAEFAEQHLRLETRVTKVAPLVDSHVRALYILETRLRDQAAADEALSERSEIYRDLDVTDLNLIDEAMKQFMAEVAGLTKGEIAALRARILREVS